MAKQREAIWAKMRESDAFADVKAPRNQADRQQEHSARPEQTPQADRPRRDDRTGQDSFDAAGNGRTNRPRDADSTEPAEPHAGRLDASASDTQRDTDQKDESGPEIVSMQLPEGYDDQGDVPWLHRRDEDRPIRPPDAADRDETVPQERRPTTQDWIPSDKAPPVDVRDQEEAAEKSLDALREPSAKLRKLSAEFVREGDDMVDLANKVSSKAGDLFRPPDQAHAETRAPQPVWQPPQHASVDFGELGGAGVALGVIMVQTVRKIRGHKND